VLAAHTVADLDAQGVLCRKEILLQAVAISAYDHDGQLQLACVGLACHVPLAAGTIVYCCLAAQCYVRKHAGPTTTRSVCLCFRVQVLLLSGQTLLLRTTRMTASCSSRAMGQAQGLKQRLQWLLLWQSCLLPRGCALGCLLQSCCCLYLLLWGQTAGTSTPGLSMVTQLGPEAPRKYLTQVGDGACGKIYLGWLLVFALLTSH
jgi:hypothetical protein